jgi:type I restriction enzyme S subunit
MRLPAYPTYRPSGIEWLGDVPEHWDVDRLKWTTSGTVNGTWGEEPNGVDDLICVRVADFDRERFLVVDEPPTLRAVEVSQRKNRLLRIGDLLIEKSGGGEKQLVGCVVFFDHDFTAVCSNFVARMPTVPSHSARFWSYAHAALYSGRLNYPAIKQTTGIQNLDSAVYLDTRVGLPPEDEQRAIADFLDRETAKIDALVAKKRTLIERLKEKRTALISRTVNRGIPPDAAIKAGLDAHPKFKPSDIEWLGDVPEHWSVKRLMYLTDKKRPIMYGIVLPGPDVPDGVPIVKGGDVKPGRLTLESLCRTTAEIESGYVRSRLATGDIVFSIRGTVGEAELVPEEIAGANLTQDAARIAPSTDVNGRWLLYAVKAEAVSHPLLSLSLGAAVRGINIRDLKKLVVPFPSSKEQLAIADYLDRETCKLDTMTDKVETATERLQEYRAALITAAVTGKIDVREAVA